MARKKREMTFVCPGWEQAVKALFLSFGLAHNLNALHQLATDVRDGKMTVRQWANQYGLGKSWVEEWAQDTLCAWRDEPLLIAELTRLVDRRGPDPKNIQYDPPREHCKAADFFRFTASAGPFTYRVLTIPTSKLSIGVTMGGSVEGEPDDDWLRFRQRMHEQFDLAFNRYQTRAERSSRHIQSESTYDHLQLKRLVHRRMELVLDKYRKSAVKDGTSRELTVPTDLHKKIEAAAFYFFRQTSSEKMVTQLVHRVGASTTVYRWVKEMADLLRLPMKPAARSST
jgi:hypothetical protein